jgi:hypothetical protein
VAVYCFHMFNKDGRILRRINRECANEPEVKRFAQDYLRHADRDIDAVEVWQGPEVFFRIRRQDLA